MKSETTRDLVEILNSWIGDDPVRRARIDAAKQRHSLAQQIYAARSKRGFTQAELAKLMGTSQSTIARLERGEMGTPNLGTLQKFAAALGLELVIDLREPRKGKSRAA